MAINLSKAVRSNLLSLQSTAAAMAKTQERLATGLKVNSALDNPSSFFTASALRSRASDMSNLLDAMSNGVKTLEAADNGLKAITKTVESMQSTLRQARQDKSFKAEAYALNLGAGVAVDGGEQITFNGGAVTGTVAVNLTTNTATPGSDTGSTTGMTGATLTTAAGIDIADTQTFSVGDGTNTYTFTGTAATTVQDLIDGINGSSVKVTASLDADGELKFVADDNTTALTFGGSAGNPPGIANIGIPTAVNTPKTVDALVQEINSNASLAGKVRVSNDNGKLRVENLSMRNLTVAGVTSGGDLDGESGTDTIGGNEVRNNLAKQFNDLRDQLDKFADDASFNGINLLRGDKLKLTFNETGSSTIDIQAKDASGGASSISNQTLGIDEALTGDLDSDTAIDARLDVLKTALGTLRSQSSAFGSNLSIVENRTDFTNAMVNTLETGAADLTLADTNEEAANLLALQTRQQLSSTALSMASQADQAVLRLFS
jgi:flagellin-like hook-associated protein FlgL